MAIQEGCFEDKRLLLLASKHLLEGMFTLMTIGALYFDIKTANILFGRHGKFEVAFTDFEKISFLQFNENDDEIIKNTSIRIPYLLANENEHLNLQKIQKNEKPAKEFIYNLHKLYVFILGAAFFEMATKMSLKKFIILKFFTAYLTKNNSDPLLIIKYWKKGCEVQDKYLCTLLDIIETKDRMFFFNLINHTRYPNVDLLKNEEVQAGLIDQMLLSDVPKYYAHLVASMLKPDLGERINIQEALVILQ
jgi:serine/threonine protein kinase